MSRVAGEASQRRMLEEYGAYPIYDAKTHTIEQMVNQLRSGDQVAVTSLGRLASTRAGLRFAIDAIHSKKCSIFEVASGRKLNGAADVAQMALEAADELALDAKGTSIKHARKWGKIGGQLTKARMQREMAGKRMGKTEAANIWRNPLLTNAQALEQMTGWTQASAYRRIGPRKLAKGRPRKPEKT